MWYTGQNFHRMPWKGRKWPSHSTDRLMEKKPHIKKTTMHHLTHRSLHNLGIRNGFATAVFVKFGIQRWFSDYEFQIRAWVASVLFSNEKVKFSSLNKLYYKEGIEKSLYRVTRQIYIEVKLIIPKNVCFAMKIRPRTCFKKLLFGFQYKVSLALVLD